jgi:hypothetical protein
VVENSRDFTGTALTPTSDRQRQQVRRGCVKLSLQALKRRHLRAAVGTGLTVEFVPSRPVGGVLQQHASAPAHNSALRRPLAFLRYGADRVNRYSACQESSHQLVGLEILVRLLGGHGLAISAPRHGGGKRC